MMLPARAFWPPKSFTPRRLLSLSRPLRLEPPAFLCAMTYCYLNLVNQRLLGLGGLCLRLSLLCRSLGSRSLLHLRRCSSLLGLGRSGLRFRLCRLGLLSAD